jgi:toxin ParE1/3/4
VKIKLDVHALAELRQALVWYEEQRPGLGEDLATEVKQALVQIERAPERWPIWENEPRIRRYFLRRFPFVIAYFVQDTGPYVIAVAHTSRTARRWLDRIGAAAKRGTRRRP